VDTLSTREQELVQAIRADWARFEELLYRYSVGYARANELRPGFPVTGAMLTDFYALLRDEGIAVDRETYEAANTWVARRLAYEISVAKFSREEGWKRLMADDPRVRAAADLLRTAGSTDEAFVLLPSYAEAHDLVLGSALQGRVQSRSSRP
jgi:hypothetical protein